MTTWKDVVKIPDETIRDLVQNRLLSLEVDPLLYGPDRAIAEDRFALMIESSHYPTFVQKVSDDEGKRAFWMGVAFLPKGFFSTICLEIPEQGEVTDVNIGLHVQGATFTPSGYHILRYNSPHLSHSTKKSSGANKWHFDVVQEDGEEVRIADVSGSLIKISPQDLIREWYAIAEESQRIVPSRQENWHIDFLSDIHEEDMGRIGLEMIAAMEKYPPFKQAIKSPGFKR